MTPTMFLLAARFEGKPAVNIEDVAEDFGLSPEEARRRATRQMLPVPTFQLNDSQKAPWMVRIDDLAKHIDAQRQESVELAKRLGR